ncbi:MAG: TSUP family transporter, partial [Deltaproteobacteria bacterium]
TSVSISPKVLNTYIGLLVAVIGVMILCGRSLILTNGKIYLLGFVSAFNKALSGGGFGPLVAGGQLVFRDRSEKGAIGSTDFAEAPICLFSFLLWVFFNGFPPAALYLPLCIGSAIGGFFGPNCLSKIKSPAKLKKILGALVLFEGLWVLYKVWGK